MARKPQFDVVGLSQHIRQRGNNRQECFLDNKDRRRYVADLEGRSVTAMWIPMHGGSDEFVRSIESVSSRRARRGKAGRPRRDDKMRL